MQIIKYGITLDSLRFSDLELVRNWRNSDEVRPFMHFRERISPEMQMKWFKDLDTTKNLYFIIKKDLKKVGLIQLKEIDWMNGNAEAGIFIAEPDYMNSTIPVLATISLMELAFEVLCLKFLKAKIESTNERTLKFNLSLGYSLFEKTVSDKFQYYKVDRESFYLATSKLRTSLHKLNKAGFTLSLTQEEKNNFCKSSNLSELPGLDLNIKN